MGVGGGTPAAAAAQVAAQPLLWAGAAALALSAAGRPLPAAVRIAPRTAKRDIALAVARQLCALGLFTGSFCAALRPCLIQLFSGWCLSCTAYFTSHHT